MVIFRITWILMMLTVSACFLDAQEEVQVRSSIDEKNISENRLISGIVTITHPENLKIDTSSFRLEGKELKVDFVKDTKISPNDPLTITIYHFEIDGKPKGLYMLPEISVVVGGTVYKSYPSTYEVQTGAVQQPASSAVTTPSPGAIAPSTKEPSLKLEASVEGKNPLYPGERLRFTYRFYFSGNIELTQEVLPLLDAVGFLKIGDKEIKDYVKDQLSVNEISQTYEAIKPGDFSFGPSVVAGYSYQEDASGNRAYSKEIIKSEAPPVKVTVLSFPEKEKPVSFSGAIGKFTFDVSLKSSREVNVGDEMTLSVEIAGKENLNTAALPEICCQPGFSGFFRLSDLPPTSEIHGDVKTFTVNLRPLTDTIKEVPSLEFSYFDPSTDSYTVLASKPIPITVKPSKALPVEDLDKMKKPKLEPEKEHQPVPPEAIEIQTNFLLNGHDLYNKAFGTWWTMLVIPLGIAFLIYQNNLRASIIKKKMEAKPVKSTELFEKAFLEHSPTPLFFALLNKAFKQALVEAKEIPQADVSTEDLPQIGFSKEVRTFLSSVDERRFSGQSNMSPTFLQGPAQTLFEKMQKSIEEKKS